MKINTYIVVFGIIIVIVIAAALSTYVYNYNPATQNVSLSNLKDFGPAPNFQGISSWINSQPLNISQLKGKVVLVDFWTYSCINCIRSIPHLNAWYSEYGGPNNGLVIVGVSTPEFQFEHNYSNVLNATQRFGIKYPVALDNNYATWDAYDNEYWPADYLVNASGVIKYEVFGEGDYNVTEQVIRELLQQAGYSVPSYTTNVPLGANFSQILTPEEYLGWQYMQEHGETLGNSQLVVPNATVNYSISGNVTDNKVYLSGEWYDAPDGMVAVNNSDIFLTYYAKQVNVVASGNAVLWLELDGKNVTPQYLGSDAHISNGIAKVNVTSSRLYNLIDAPSYGPHTIEIAASPGFKIYTFTFG